MQTDPDRDDLGRRKRDLRKTAGARRKQFHAALAPAARAALAETGLGFCGHQSGTVSAFMPYRTEIDVTGLLERLDGEGRTLCLPVVTGAGEPLVFRRWRPGEQLVAGIWNIPVPPETADMVEPDVLIVPLLAFDRQGYRLGYGGGFYDRTLVKLRAKMPVVAIGAGFSGQEVEAVPRDDLDQRLDWILTEEGPLKVAGGP